MNAIRSFLQRHPRLAMWAALAVGMAIILMVAARGKDLSAGQLAGLVLVCVAVAGACAWIIGWEEGDLG